MNFNKIQFVYILFIREEIRDEQETVQSFIINRFDSCIRPFGAGTQSVYAETPVNKTATSPVDDHLIPEERLANALKTWGN